MATTQQSGKKIALLSFWRSHQILQQGAVLPLEGFAPAGVPIRVLFLRQSVGEEPICLFSQELQADGHGQFRTTLEIPHFEGAQYQYALIVQVLEPGRSVTGYRHLLQADGAHELVLRDLRIGEVWLALGCHQTFVPISSCWDEEDYDWIESDSLLRFASIPNQGDDPLRWKAVEGSSLESLPLLLYAFLHQMRNLHQDLPIGVVYPELPTAEEGMGSVVPPFSTAFQTWLPDQPGFEKYLKRLTGLGLRGIFVQPDESTCHQVSVLQDQLQQGVKELEIWARPPQGHSLCWIYSHFRVLPRTLQVMGEQVRPILLANQVLSDWTERLDRPCTVLPVYDLSLFYQPLKGVGDPNLPLYREEEGRRLALLASTLTRGARNHLPPRCIRIQRQDAGLVLTFAGFAGSLTRADTRRQGGQELLGFYLSDRGHPPRPAQARLLSRDRVYVFHPDVREPHTCSYAYAPWALEANLVSDAGVPALPFVLGDWQGTAHPLLWTQFDRSECWGIQTLQEHSPRSFPAELPLRRYGSGVWGREVWNPSAGGWSLELEYPLLHENQKHRTPGEWIPLWGPAGPYVYPKQPDWNGYRVLTALVTNLDSRPKQISLGQGRSYILPAYVRAMPLSFPLSAVSRPQGKTPLIFSVCDTGNLRDQGRGGLLFSHIELWQNEEAAERWVRFRNQMGTRIHE